jgi:hypothetical protein
MPSNALSEGDSGKRGFPVVSAETAEAVKLVRSIVNQGCGSLPWRSGRLRSKHLNLKAPIPELLMLTRFSP